MTRCFLLVSGKNSTSDTVCKAHEAVALWNSRTWRQWAQTSVSSATEKNVSESHKLWKSLSWLWGQNKPEKIRDTKTQIRKLPRCIFFFFSWCTTFQQDDLGFFFTFACTHQGTVRLRRVSTGDVGGVQRNLQVLGHVCCLWLAGHVVPGQAFVGVNLGLTHIVVAPCCRVVLHGRLANAGPQRLQRQRQMETHDCSPLSSFSRRCANKESLFYFHLLLLTQLEWGGMPKSPQVEWGSV